MSTSCRLVIIRWQDSRQPCGQWRYLATLADQRPVEVASVGWLVKDTADVKVLCQNIGDLAHPENAQASGIMTIPTRCVVSIENLTEEGEPTFFADPGDFADPVAGTAADHDRKTGSAPMPRALESLQA